MHTKNPRTYFSKVWDIHKVDDAGDGYDLLGIDRLLLHERTGGVALKSLAQRGFDLKIPDRVFAVIDHIVSFKSERGRDDARTPGGEAFIQETREMAISAGIHLIDTDSPDQGIVHVVAPELGLAIPGASIVCPDSHTCSLGAIGALAWGIGSSEAEHIMATGVLRAKKPPQMRIHIDGTLKSGVSAKDVALHLIAKYGADGAKRSAIEFVGSAVSAMTIEERLTLCNLAIEFSAYTAIIPPDAHTLNYVAGRRFAPSRDVLERHIASLQGDEGATFDYELFLKAEDISPQISWGTNPEESVALSGCVPDKASTRSLDYMGLETGDEIAGQSIGGAFIGSCTNGRLSDLRAAAAVLKGRKIANGVRAVCVPGSQSVKREAEALGLDDIFQNAGFEWGAPGCAMCFYAGGETFLPGTRVVSTTNRNFEGRQGPGVRTHLASPAVVAASAIAGVICAPSDLPLIKGNGDA